MRVSWICTEADGVSIPRWCGVGHCRSRGRLQQLLAVGLVGRELLPHVPTSGLRVGGGAGGGAATPTAAAVGDDGAGGAGVHRGRGPLLRREVGLAELGLLVPLPLLLQAQAQVVVGKVCGQMMRPDQHQADWSGQGLLGGGVHV